MRTKRALLTSGIVLALGVVFAPMAEAAAPLPVYADSGACNQDAAARTTAAGGPLSGTTFSCTTTSSVPNGVAGCPPATPLKHDGCIGTYYQVTENSV
jgi:hypothetical protein